MGSRSQVQPRGISDRAEGGRNGSRHGVVVDGAVAGLVNNLREFEQKLADEIGPFALFALLLRDGSPNRWDLIVAADWLSDTKRESLVFIAGRLSKFLPRRHLVLISRIVPINARRGDFFKAIRRLVTVQHGLEEVSGDIAGVQIERGYVITCASPTSRLQAAKGR